MGEPLLSVDPPPVAAGLVPESDVLVSGRDSLVPAIVLLVSDNYFLVPEIDFPAFLVPRSDCLVPECDFVVAARSSPPSSR